MIEKITIGNIASFKEKQSLETDKKINLIYGLNGSGKTTMSNYLQDVNNEDNIKGFDSDKQKILVYNRNFIQNTFYESDTQKGIFSLGEDNKQALENIKNAEAAVLTLNSKLEDKKGEAKTIAEEIKKNETRTQEKTWEIVTKDKKSGSNIFDINDFFKRLQTQKKLLNHLLNIDLLPVQKGIDDIEKELQELSKDATRRVPLNPISLESFQKIEENPFFKQSIIGNENSTVSTLITELKNSDWVKRGLIYVDLEERQDCPFCQQKTLNKELIKEIENYFDDSYKKNIKTIEKLKAEYKELKKNLPLESGDFFTREQKSEHQILGKTLITILDKNINSIKQKIDNPSQSIELSSSKDSIEELNKFIGKINNEIQAFNAKLGNRKKTIENLENEFWQIRRKEYDGVITEYWTNKKTDEKRKKDLEEEIKDIKKNIEEQNKTISDNRPKVSNIEKTIEKINGHLLYFGISDFEIILDSQEDETYKLQRDEDSENIFPTLSEGEKTVISFLYFVELCIGEESQNETREKIVVIDDPISSLSHTYIFNVAELLNEHFLKGELFIQCFVLTHNLYFFNELIWQTRNKKKNRKFFRISKNKNNRIEEMEKNEIQNEYQSYWSIIKSNNENNKFIVANAMRNIIEYFFGFMEKRNDLNEIFKKTELSDNKYQAFKRYINRESHSDPTNIFDYKDFDLTNFRDAFEKTFMLTSHKEHYDAMIQQMNPDISSENAIQKGT